MTEHRMALTPDNPAWAGQASYTPAMLKLYDFGVIGLSNRFIWRCPSKRMLSLYDRHVSQRHLEVGPGSGYYLDHYWNMGAAPTLTLLDLNTNSLRHSSERLVRFSPTLQRANVLEPIDLPPESFDSISFNYVLHCLPGSITEKASVVFGHLARLLAPGGVLFGSTIVNAGGEHNRLAGPLMRFYNRKGIFSNVDDSVTGLKQAATVFPEADVQVCGSVALFVFRKT